MAGFDAGERIVVPFLQGFAQTQLDLLLISHADADHAGGAQAVLNALTVTTVVSGQPLEHPARFAAQACTEQQWQWDGVWFWRWQWRNAQDSNQKSCVLLIHAQGERLLLTGDLDAAGGASWQSHFNIATISAGYRTTLCFNIARQAQQLWASAPTRVG